MSIRLLAILRCDTCENGEYIPPPFTTTARGARAAAAEDGWGAKPDRCLECMASTPTSTTPPARNGGAS